MLTVIIALILIGYLLVIVEVFVPGGILGVLGVLLVIGGLVLSFREYGPVMGLLVSLGSLIGCFFILYFGIRHFRDRISLGTSMEDHFASDEKLADLVGKIGVAQSTLRPVGIAEFDGRRVDVTAEQEFIQPGERIRVTRVDWNRVVVERVDPPRT